MVERVAQDSLDLLRGGEVVGDKQDGTDHGPTDWRSEVVLESKVEVQVSEGQVEKPREEKLALWRKLVQAQTDFQWIESGISRQGMGTSTVDIASADGEVRTSYFRSHKKREEM